MKRNSSIPGISMLIIASAIWGMAFVAQVMGMDSMQPFTFTMFRAFVGGIFLIFAVVIVDKIRKNNRKLFFIKERRFCVDVTKTELIAGIVCGAVLFVAINLQQIGIGYTSAGKAGFLTSLYIVIVPIVGIFMGRRPRFTVWIGVALACTGVYLLSITEGFTISLGDILVILCALVFSADILLVEYYSPKVDGIRMSSIQFLVVGVLSAIVAFAFEEPSWTQFADALGPVLYVGIMSSGFGYTLQILGQRSVNSTVAALIMSLEAVFAALGSIAILGDSMSAREMVGCVILFCALIVAQILPPKEGAPKKEEQLEP